MKLDALKAREILDSRGNPTLEVDVTLADGSFGRAAVPSGASTGTNEAHELRDGDAARYRGKGVTKAAANVTGEIAQALLSTEISDQAALDRRLIELDGTPTKERLGANAILGVSLAFAHATAQSQSVPLYTYVGQLSTAPRAPLLPLPLCNIVNGGKHASGSTDIQEFMILPVGAPTFREALRMMTEVFHALGKVLASRGYATTVGDEGGYAPAVEAGNREALELIAEATQLAGYDLGADIVLGLDVAASELRAGDGYRLTREDRSLSTSGLIEFYAELASEFPIKSIEDGLAEDDWAGWTALTGTFGKQVQLVGDDLLVTNVNFLQRAINEHAANAILIKVNQIGTLTETVAAVDMAHSAGWHAIISHRSGETEDTTIAHLAVGLGTGQIKTGSTSRSDRTAKYNELLRIEEGLGSSATFAGATTFVQ